MTFFLFLSLSTIQAAGLVALVCGSHYKLAHIIGPSGVSLGSLIGLVPVLSVMITGNALSGEMVWRMPFGPLAWRIDHLSAFFLLPIFVLSAASAVYGGLYLQSGPQGRKNSGVSWFFFGLLVDSMALVVIARNGFFFLLVWEIMSLSSFFLVTYEHEEDSVRQAGWIYLVATHIGTAFLLALFVLLARETGSMSFDSFEALRFHQGNIAGFAFILALIGFGTKAGFIPFHVWLPEAHPAAPSHVSALMSGVMIKTGIYGLVRILTFLSPFQSWWGYVLIGFGLISGILGVVFALAQHDIKRLLAYHSVENIGIIALGLGLGVIGACGNLPGLAFLGFGGALLHVLNHALFKGLLFLSAGSVLHATGTRNMESLGGLIKPMPWTAATFAVGSVAICGLPPLNGFISEFFLYSGAFHAIGRIGVSVPAAAVMIGLAMIGSLAVACFTKVFGVVFLGETRSTLPQQVHESGAAMLLPMFGLAAGCVVVAAAAPWLISWISPVIAVVAGVSAETVQTHLALVQAPLQWITRISALLLAATTLFWCFRNLLLSRRAVTVTGTWDCGYVRPTPRMQYTASSFASPLTRIFSGVLQSRTHAEPVIGLFPRKASFHSQMEDLFHHRIYEPFFNGLDRLRDRLQWIQEGRVQIYVLYIAATLLALLIWNL
ncbi:proton-conducting transporter membrane subunit [Desulfatirhabdium butyrativorans]|uniref:proton-conducting transporter transmembrane domain-containing protein n=1 Tax=Desulfatirhabdium butyrativorans TaxID=340467 RepID=UPI0004245FE0|nr:proton-conducting transporter membrane subunit [Desulfatirhabdium butyrativorans]